MDIQSEVNKSAQKERHSKHFSNKDLKNKRVKTFMKNLSGFFSKKRNKREVILDSSNMTPIVLPAASVIRKSIVTGVAFLFSVSLIPSGVALDTGFSLEGQAFINPVEMPAEELLLEEDGYLTKTIPQTEDSENVTDKANHTVKSGETISGIAYKYGLRTDTILWENNLSKWNYLKVGQKLVIPPKDGVSHKIAKNDTLDKIAKKYKVEPIAITKHNSLEEEQTLKAGETLFVPGGKKIVPIIVKKTSPVRTGSSTVNYVPKGNKPFIFPTSGSLTQGYHRGHYGHDIAHRSKPPVWAAGAGKVVKAYVGNGSRYSGGGYGNYVIVSHGNGVQTLYAHLEAVYVTKGMEVEQGQILGKMGRTGRVFGVTGIHLHFEVRVNGVRKNPWLYY